MDVFGTPSPFCADEKVLHQLFLKMEQMVNTYLKKELDSVKKKMSEFDSKYNKKTNELEDKLKQQNEVNLKKNKDTTNKNSSE